MRTEAEKTWVKKQTAWLTQTEISIMDSTARMGFHERQIELAKKAIEICKEQIQMDEEQHGRELALLQKWCEGNPE